MIGSTHHNRYRESFAEEGTQSMADEKTSNQFPQGILELLVPHAVDEGVPCRRHHQVQN